MKPEFIVSTERGGFPEKLHYGFILVIDENYKTIVKIGEDENTLFPFRSGAKPLQASVIIDSGTDKFLGMQSEEIAVICASHAGTPTHVEIIRKILKKIHLTPDSLQCGAHMPLDPEERGILIKQGKQPLSLHNNCSGKHAGMLSVCVKNNWDTKTYLDINHPLQKQIMQNIKNLCNLKEVPPGVRDGCSAPVPVLSHYNMGVGFLNLILNPAYDPIKQAISQKPYIAGGNGRLDSEIIAASEGKLLAKVAAEGVCIVANMEESRVLVVKIIDADFKARSVAVIESLKKLGWLSEGQLQNSKKLSFLDKRELTNCKGEIVGGIKSFISL